MFTQYKKTIATIPPGRIGIHLEDFVSDVSSTIVTLLHYGPMTTKSPANYIFIREGFLCRSRLFPTSTMPSNYGSIASMMIDFGHPNHHSRRRLIVILECHD